MLTKANSANIILFQYGAKAGVAHLMGYIVEGHVVNGI
jgi:hypothetical protein